MKITLLTYGSQGDLEPFVALGQRLCQAGHTVRLAGPETYQSRFELGSIEYIPLPGNPASLVQDLADQAGTNRYRIISIMSRFVVPLAVQVFDQAKAACQGADLIIHSFLLTSAGMSLGEELEIPTISAQLFPVFSPTNEFPAPTFPDLRLGPIYRTLTHQMVSGIFKWGSRFLYQRVRVKNPQLSELRRWIPGDQAEGAIPILYGFSSQVVLRPRDWEDNAHITGYWLLDPQLERSPPQEAVDFLSSGTPPITVALGSTRTDRLKDINQKIIKALSACEQRGIIIADQLNTARINPNILQLGYAPYRWLFNRSAAVIHHGGAGTTARGLMAGLPNIILPFTSDQPFWARRVHTLGTGPKPIPARRLTTLALIEAVQEALTDQTLRAKANQIGRQLRKEDGVSRALKIIEDYLN